MSEFEIELRAYLASKVADGTIISGDLTEVNDTSLTGQAIVVTLNPSTNETKQRNVFLYKTEGVIHHYVLKKIEDGWEPITVKQQVLVTNSSTTPLAIDGLAFNLVSGQRVHFNFMGVYRSSSLTTGIGFVFEAPASSQAHWMLSLQTSPSGANQMMFGASTSLENALTSTSVGAIDTDLFWKVEGFCTANEDGVLQLCCKSEVEGSEIGVLNQGFGILTTIENVV